jgi:hypothetical protein
MAGIRREHERQRSGIALFGALALLALLGLLVAGAFASALLDTRSARTAQTDAELTTGGDYALQTVLAEWDARHLAELHVGETRLASVDIPTTAIRASVSITALPTGVLWMVAELANTRGDEARRVNFVARFPFVAFMPDAALTSRGHVQIGDDVRFSVDSTSDPDCPHSPATNVMLAPGAELHVTGTPTAPIDVDTSVIAADSSRYLLHVDPVTLRRNPHLTYVAGDTTIDGGSASGVWLVRGHIRVTGPFVFSGLLIAGDGLEATAGGAFFRGAVMAFAAPDETGIRLAGATLEFAPCITLRALKMAHAPRAVRERSWAELY